MKYKLINPPNPNYYATTQILINRGIREITDYLHLSDKDINSPTAFGKELMDGAAECFLKHLNSNSVICVIVD